ncbi:hypothetical protein MGI18_14130 [Bacillus sp. OVS6]|nr:hypothetical protein MGI18_14130 [Bacillus sp. OVS6]
MAEAIWVIEIVEAIRKLGGQAKLVDIYNEIEGRHQITLSDYVDWKAQVRKNIYLHSSLEVKLEIPLIFFMHFQVKGKELGV